MSCYARVSGLIVVAALVGACGSDTETAAPVTAEPPTAVAFSESNEQPVPETSTTLAASPAVADPSCVVVEPALSALGSLQAIGPDSSVERVAASFAVLDEELHRLVEAGPEDLVEHALVLQATYRQLGVLWETRGWDYATVLGDPVIAADLEMLATWRVTVAQDTLVEWAAANCV